jgi:hypothetical protein
MKGGEEEGGCFLGATRIFVMNKRRVGIEAAIKGMVLVVGNWIGRQKGAINFINVPFTGVKILSN